MSTVMVSLEEYLNTAYSPDREYVDGVVVERHVGERPHSLVQSNIVFSLRRLQDLEGELTAGAIQLPLEEIFRGL
jgi:hypothetical protein